MRRGRVALGAALALALAPGSACAAITVVGSNTASTATNTLTITKPTNTLSGNVMVAVVSGAGTTAISAPAGWTLVQDTTSGALRQVAYVHVAGGSEPSTYAFTSATSRNASGGITSYSGVNTTVPVDASGEALGASGKAVSPSVTTTTASDQVITAVATATATSWTAATGTVERYDKASTSTTQEVADASQLTAGATPARTVTPVILTGAWTAQTIALRDAASAGLSFTSAVGASFSADIDGGDQTAAYSVPLTVLDTRTGASAGLGWSVTLTSTTLTTGTASLPASATTVTAATATCANGGVCVAAVNGTAYPVTVPAAVIAPSAVKVASLAAGSAEGAFSLPLSLSVSVPQNSFTGTYASTLTVAVVTGP